MSSLYTQYPLISHQHSLFISPTLYSLSHILLHISICIYVKRTAAITSQLNSQLWVGTLSGGADGEFDPMTAEFEEDGVVYDFPRNANCEVCGCNVYMYCSYCETLTIHIVYFALLLICFASDLIYNLSLYTSYTSVIDSVLQCWGYSVGWVESGRWWRSGQWCTSSVGGCEW